MNKFSNQDMDIIKRSPLFSGITDTELNDLLASIPVSVRSHSKGTYIYTAGEKSPSLGLVLSGQINIENTDAWGNQTILDAVTDGQIFAETYACVPNMPLLVNVYAVTECRIMFLNVKSLLSESMSPVSEQSLTFSENRLIRNLLAITSQKNLILSRRMLHTTPKAIRDRVISYLSYQALQAGSNDFTIPFNRQQLAEYLNVDRSALSNELGKMSKEGLIEFKKNHFILINTN